MTRAEIANQIKQGGKTMIETIYDSELPAISMVASAIRDAHGGMVSGEPVGVRYPGVPHPAEILDRMGCDPETPLTEDEWFQACDLIDPE